MSVQILKGDIAASVSLNEIKTVKDGYIVVKDEICEGIFEEIPEEYKDIEITDFTGQLIMPGLNDLHIHAPQYQFRGLDFDLDLLDWLHVNAFNEEAKYKDLEYAKKAYTIFVDELLASPTTRLSAFGTIHPKATLLLMEMLEEKGMAGNVGKVNMTRYAIDELHETVESSYEDTKWFIDESRKFKNIKPTITPRFIPSCDDELMYKLGELGKKEDVCFQSHLNEDASEIKWVKELCPWSTSYGDAYDKFGMMNEKTIMAHCVYDYDLELMKERGIWVAHCPECNANIRNGISPVSKMLQMGIHVGMGTDVSGGSTINLFSSMRDALMMAKLRWKLVDDKYPPLTVEQVFYLATAGGGSYFGKVGMFEKGYEFDAIVFDDKRIKSTRDLSVKQRLERVIQVYGEADKLTAKYVKGNRLY